MEASGQKRSTLTHKRHRNTKAIRNRNKQRNPIVDGPRRHTMTRQKLRQRHKTKYNTGNHANREKNYRRGIQWHLEEFWKYKGKKI